MPELPDSGLRLITCVNYHRRLALLAESDMDHGAAAERIHRAIGDHTAEVGFVLRDDRQNQGVALEHVGVILR